MSSRRNYWCRRYSCYLCKRTDDFSAALSGSPSFSSNLVNSSVKSWQWDSVQGSPLSLSGSSLGESADSSSSGQELNPESFCRADGGLVSVPVLFFWDEVLWNGSLKSSLCSSEAIFARIVGEWLLHWASAIIAASVEIFVRLRNGLRRLRSEVTLSVVLFEGVLDTNSDKFLFWRAHVKIKGIEISGAHPTSKLRPYPHTGASVARYMKCKPASGSPPSTWREFCRLAGFPLLFCPNTLRLSIWTSATLCFFSLLRHGQDSEAEGKFFLAYTTAYETKLSGRKGGIPCLQPWIWSCLTNISRTRLLVLWWQSFRLLAYRLWSFCCIIDSYCVAILNLTGAGTFECLQYFERSVF